MKLTSRAYDLVMNGEALGGGSIRISNRDVQNRIFQALGLSDSEIAEKFGFFLKAFDYGIPPHGGIALGMDRVVSMILRTQSIREVIAFPKNRNAFCPLTKAPSTVSHKQMAELGLVHQGAGQGSHGIKHVSPLKKTS
jgi:aspartyl-tRNA synthetase